MVLLSIHILYVLALMALLSIHILTLLTDAVVIAPTNHIRGIAYTLGANDGPEQV